MTFWCSLSLPSFATLFAFLLLSILVCACILFSNIGCICCCSISTISIKIILLRWLLYNVGCLIWILMTYRPLRQFENMWLASSKYSILIIFVINYLICLYVVVLSCTLYICLNSLCNINKGLAT